MSCERRWGRAAGPRGRPPPTTRRSPKRGAVYGAAQTLLRHDFALDETGRERFVSLIADESERLGRIVNEILLANQLDPGRLDLDSEPFDAHDVVERVVESTRMHAPPSVTFEVEAPESVPQVAADADKVRQVLVNLVE